ncbi:MAG: ParB family transcriptional regulator, chromosome partitioning protein [Verrucomicrobiota bacterium]|jgi:ParB/RepB/Spo0J family partition protein
MATITIPKSHAEELIPSGTPATLTINDIIPSRSNPRHLFDRPQLDALKKNIRQHGVLVPLTLYRPRGQKKYSILDGERRYRCCVELEEEGQHIDIPANVVSPPSKIAGILYMFSIHNFREQWELMPTALALKTIMDTLEERDNVAINKLTGLSEPQIERCKILLQYPDKYQQMSLLADPAERIPSNFWIELFPVLELCKNQLPDLYEEHTRNGVVDLLIEKYRARKIKSVIHFRRIMEAYEVADDQRGRVLQRLRSYILNKDVETRQAFDEFVVDERRVRNAIDACGDFVRGLQRLKLDYTLDRDELRAALQEVRQFVNDTLTKLEGSDPSSEEK